VDGHADLGISQQQCACRLKLKVMCPSVPQYLVRTQNDIEQVRGTYLLRGASLASSAFNRWGVPKKGGQMVR